MCDFGLSTGLALAMAAASSVTQHIAANEEASAQAAYQAAQQKANNEAAVQNANAAIREQVEQTAAERTQQMQHNDAAARDKQANQKDFLQKRGTALASSSSNGLALEALMADYERAYAFNNDVIDEQLKMQGASADINVRGYRDRADSRISSHQGYIPTPIKGTSTLASGLSLAGNVLGTWNQSTNYGRSKPWDSEAPKPKTAGH